MYLPAGLRLVVVVVAAAASIHTPSYYLKRLFFVPVFFSSSSLPPHIAIHRYIYYIDNYYSKHSYNILTTMHPKTFITASLLSASAVLAQDTGKLGDAQVVTDNPVGPVYVATLPESDESTIRGFISGTANDDGTGVKFEVEFHGLPEGGPFSKHLLLRLW